MRLSIEITPEQHKKLKAIAALQGKSIKEYVLEKSLPSQSAQYRFPQHRFSQQQFSQQQFSQQEAPHAVDDNQYDLSDEEETLRQLESLFESRNDAPRQRTPTANLEEIVYDMIS